MVVASTLFGDIRPDLGPACPGTIGIAPSGNTNPTGAYRSLFEPVHGSAPDIAGKGIANPIAMIASFGMALRYSFGLVAEADLLDRAIAGVLAKGLRTADIHTAGTTACSTSAMGDAIITEVERLAKS